MPGVISGERPDHESHNQASDKESSSTAAALILDILREPREPPGYAGLSSKRSAYSDESSAIAV